MAAWAMESPPIRPEEVANRLGRTYRAVMWKAHMRGIKFGMPPRAPVVRSPIPDLLPVVRAALPPSTEDVEVRHIAAYIATVEMELSQAVAAAIIERTPRLVAYAVRRIEDRRDDPDYDAMIDGVANAARRIAA